jgi:hypothetical protein
VKAREYAISQGLAKAGKGKLSKQAHTAIQLAILEGYVFDDYKEGKVVKNDSNPRTSRPVVRSLGLSEEAETESSEPKPIKSNPVTHDYSTVWGIDVLRLKRAIPIAYQFCSKCLLQVKYCVHEIPKLPEYLGGGNALTHYPTNEDMSQAVKNANLVG